MKITQDPTPPADQDNQAPSLGREIIWRLHRGELPQMVDWFDPALLAKVGVRSVISATLGQYTDQRLIQAATDNVSEGVLRGRYDYSGDGVAPAVPSDPNGAVWVDYLADLGDGFEPTYAMAYLLSADELQVEGQDRYLPAGQLLIMGGDQVYPDATKQEYDNRLRDPYDWAFSINEPKRKLFAIPGNHDWYDGLSAFSALFCSARDRISGGIGAQIGGWRCHQHRSYFAIKLPYDWWIWGPDIQLSDNLDDSQRDYFDLMADQTKVGDNIILCLAEPSWLHKNYDNLHEISMLARKNGAKICAVLAGDWHHYSRYENETLGTQFITSGGGGAFAHATHGLKSKIELKWAMLTGRAKRISDPKDSLDFNRSEQSAIGSGGPDFTQQNVEVSAESPDAPPQASEDHDESFISRRIKAIRKEAIESIAYICRATHIYPPRWLSRLLCLKNLAVPFRNRGFAALVGIVYFLYAWAYVTADPRQSPIMLKFQSSIASEEAQVRETISYIEGALEKLKADRQALQEDGGVANQDDIRELSLKIAAAEENLQGAKGELVRVKARQKALMDEHQRKTQANFENELKETIEDTSLGFFTKAKHAAYTIFSYALGEYLDPKGLLAAAEQSPFFAFLLFGLWALLISYVESEWRVVRLLLGTAHFAVHLWTLLIVSFVATTSAQGIERLATTVVGTGELSVLSDVARISWRLFVTFFVGGVLGGFVMGLYWTLTSTLFNMHTGDAFGALGIKDYKHFLRIQLEPGKATIYPIALDHIPGRFGWRWKLHKGELLPSHNPQILPETPLRPRLIEPPIVIHADKVQP